MNNSKVFYERFNRELSLLGLPEDKNEKTKAIAKVFNVTRHLANEMIFGRLPASQEQLNRIAEVLEVCPRWLGGASDKKKGFSNINEKILAEEE